MRKVTGRLTNCNQRFTQSLRICYPKAIFLFLRNLLNAILFGMAVIGWVYFILSLAQ
jgi:hypothetical protein